MCLFYFVCVWFACMCFCVLCECSAHRGHKRMLYPLQLGLQYGFWATMQVLSTESGSSGEDSIFNCWAISPVAYNHRLFYSKMNINSFVLHLVFIMNWSLCFDQFSLWSFGKQQIILFSLATECSTCLAFQHAL